MNRRTLALLLAAVLIVAITAAIVLRGRADRVETATAELGSIDVTIQTVGTLQAPSATVVRSPATGTIAALGVAAGDVIETGDIVLLLDRTQLERALWDAESALIDAEFALQFAELRAEEAPDDRTRQFEVLGAAQRLERAQEAVQRAQQALAATVVTAPAAGTTIELLVRVGEGVGANQPVARIASRGDLRLVADVDELDLPNVQLGAEARFRFDAYPATEIIGMVESTAPAARQQGGATVFATTIGFDPPADLDLRPGMNADVTIVTEARENVLLIPDRALRTVGERSYVTVRTGDREEEREVILGYRGGGLVEIVSGLVEGETVVLR